MPVWKPASNQLAFVSNRRLHFEVYLKPIDGREPEAPLLAEAPDKFPNDSSLSKDGQRFLVNTAVRAATPSP
jgi:Tol biopolymer transport system component